MAPLAVGLMSGTSADGVTAALVRFPRRGVQVVRHRTFPFPRPLRLRLLEAAALAAPELSRLNFELGRVFAQAALAVIGNDAPAVIGSHGQTVWHGPLADPPNTMQLGEPSVIAEITSLPVVADFRPRDMAAGGQGAPLVPAFDEFLFSRGPLRALQNIGGVGNVSIAGGGRLWTAFDTGPGNSLMDLAVRAATKGRAAMDEGGRLARRGRADQAAIAQMMKHPYFRRPAPKSIDKELFGKKFLKEHFAPLGLRSLPDVLATLNEFTARAIADSYARLPMRAKLAEAVVSGGGALNPTLMANLRRLLSPLPVVTSQAHGIPVMAKEAACFAWLALRAWKRQPNNCPRATGARGARILGKIILA